jgi:hypothetical protein
MVAKNKKRLRRRADLHLELSLIYHSYRRPSWILGSRAAGAYRLIPNLSKDNASS